uniref:AT-hook motif nuclear-localized protein 10-like n=1 Tax=Tanacetum cinerariifolium TaxID=118510 RepID=A0A699HLM1_TANCI|nr:AT-hook motif nuclear-localized protein 10-like [Tanacetum cinerariifolium]
MSYETTTIYTTDAPTTAFRPHAPGYTTNNPNDGDNSYALTVPAPPELGYGGGEVKRKRGRPRKYPVDGSVAPATATGEFESPATADGKKPRGRPKGSANKHQPVASGCVKTM